MIKKIIESYVIKTKRSDFAFDKKLPTGLIFLFSFRKVIALLRGSRMLFTNHQFNKIFFGKSVNLFNKKNIVMGNNVNIGDFVQLNALGHDQLSIGNDVNIGAFSQVIISTTFDNLGRHIKIGNNVGIGEFSYLGGAGGLTIDDDTIIGQYFSAHPENHTFSNSEHLIREQRVERQGIRVGSNCWVGAKVTILDGVIIGNNCVIAAGAVVTKSCPDNVVIAGVPAKIIKNLGK